MSRWFQGPIGLLLRIVVGIYGLLALCNLTLNSSLSPTATAVVGSATDTPNFEIDGSSLDYLPHNTFVERTADRWDWRTWGEPDDSDEDFTVAVHNPRNVPVYNQSMQARLS